MYLYILFGYFLVPFSCICFHFWGCHHLPLLTRHSETHLKKNEVRFEDHSHDRRTSLGWWNRVWWDRSTLFFAEWCSNLILQNLRVIPFGLRQGWQKVVQYFHVFLQMQLKCQAIQVCFCRDLTWPLAYFQTMSKTYFAESGCLEICTFWAKGSCETQSGFTWLQRSFRRGGPSMEKNSANPTVVIPELLNNKNPSL